jgi:hypothetical protein
VADLIKSTAVDLGTGGKDAYYGFGRIDIAKALDETLQTAVTPNVREKPIQPPPKNYLDWANRFLNRLRIGSLFGSVQ